MIYVRSAIDNLGNEVRIDGTLPKNAVQIDIIVKNVKSFANMVILIERLASCCIMKSVIQVVGLALFILPIPIG